MHCRWKYKICKNSRKAYVKFPQKPKIELEDFTILSRDTSGFIAALFTMAKKKELA